MLLRVWMPAAWRGEKPNLKDDCVNLRVVFMLAVLGAWEASPAIDTGESTLPLAA